MKNLISWLNNINLEDQPEEFKHLMAIVKNPYLQKLHASHNEKKKAIIKHREMLNDMNWEKLLDSIKKITSCSLKKK